MGRKRNRNKYRRAEPGTPYPLEQLRGWGDLSVLREKALPENVQACLGLALATYQQSDARPSWHAIDTALSILLRRLWLNNTTRNSPTTDPRELLAKLVSSEVLGWEHQAELEPYLDRPANPTQEQIVEFWAQVYGMVDMMLQPIDDNVTQTGSRGLDSPPGGTSAA